MTFFSYTKQKYVIFFAFICIFSCMVFSQEAELPENTVSIQDENDILFDDPATVDGIETENLNSSSSIWILVRIVLVLILVCVAIYALLAFVKKQTKSIATDDPHLKSVAFLPLSTNKSVQVITLGEQAFLIGVSDSNISLLSEITNKEIIDTMVLTYDKSKPRTTGSFASLLSLFSTTKNTNESVKEDSNSPTDFIKNIRQRLNKTSQDIER